MEWTYSPKEWFDVWDKAMQIAESARNSSIDQVMRKYYQGMPIQLRGVSASVHPPSYRQGTKRFEEVDYDLHLKSWKHFQKVFTSEVKAVAFSARLPEIEGIKMIDLEDIPFGLISSPFLLQYLLATPSHILPCLYPRIENYPESTLFVRSEHPLLYGE